MRASACGNKRYGTQSECDLDLFLESVICGGGGGEVYEV